MDFTTLIKSFAVQYHVPNVEVTDDRVAFSIDGMSVALVYSATEDTVTVYGEIGDVPQHNEGHFEALLLKANLTMSSQAVLCQNPDSGTYAIFHVCTLNELSPEKLGEEVEKITNLVAEWKDNLENYRIADNLAKKAQEEKQENLNNIMQFTPYALRA